MGYRAKLLATLGVALAIVTVASGVALLVCRIQSQAYTKSMEMAFPPRVEALIADEVEESLSVTEDWGNWDGLYNAVLTGDNQFLRNNIGPKSLDDTESVFIAVYDLDGWTIRVDASAQFNDKEIGGIVRDRPLPMAGLMRDPVRDNVYYRFTAANVRQSDGAGEPAGILVMIRPLEEEELWRAILGASTTLSDDPGVENHTFTVAETDVLTGLPLDVHFYYDHGSDTLVPYRVTIGVIVVLWMVMFGVAGTLYRIVGITYPERIRRIADKAMVIAGDILGDEREIVYVGRCAETRRLVTAINTLLQNGRSALAAKDEAIAERQAVIETNEQRVAEHLRVLDELASHQGQMALQARVDAVASLAQGIAHNVNNALSVILGYIEVIMLDVKAGKVTLPQGILDRLEMIAASGSTIKETVAGLRKLYHETERDLQFTPCDVNRMVGEIVEMMRGSFHDGGVTRVAQNLDMNLPTTLALSGELRDAIVNLIRNAIEAMTDEGGTVEITTHLTEDENGHWVDIGVSDTGTGMDEETRRRCVDFMFTTKELGSGVGLPTVAGTARRHKGRLEIASELGVGSTFTLHIPFRPVDPMSLSEEVVHMYHAEGVKILYAEDEPPIRRLVTELLNTNGFTVESVERAEEALEQLADGSAKFDLVLTDLAMPGELDGRAVAKAAYARGIPVVIMTGYGHVAGDVPHNGLVCKPFRTDKLIATIDKALGHEEENT